jgi:hypothetical protein
MDDDLRPVDSPSISLARGVDLEENLHARGFYIFRCFTREGTLRWGEALKNTVVTEGKNLSLDTLMAGSSYSVAGPYMGLISSVSFSAISSGDTGSGINTTNAWKEAGLANAPTYAGNRKTCVWSAASAGSKSLSSALGFAITSNGTVRGAFILLGAGALATKDDAHGILWSAGTFATARDVLSGDSINVSYSVSM